MIIFSGDAGYRTFYLCEIINARGLYKLACRLRRKLTKEGGSEGGGNERALLSLAHE